MKQLFYKTFLLLILQYVLTNNVLAARILLLNGNELLGEILTQTDTHIELQMGTSRILLKLEQIKSIDQEEGETYLKNGKKALEKKDYYSAKNYFLKALHNDPHNTAIQQLLDEVEFSEIEQTSIFPIIKNLKKDDLTSYRNALISLDDIKNKERFKPFISHLNQIIADVKAEYAQALYDRTWNDEAFKQLREAYRAYPFSEKFHKAVAHIQKQMGNMTYAQEEENLGNKIIADADIEYEAIDQINQDIQNDIPTEAYWMELARHGRQYRTEIKNETEYASILTKRQMSLLLQAYNAGPGAVVAYDGYVPYRETIKYVKRIAGYMESPPNHKLYDDLVVKFSKKHGLDSNLVRCLIKAESGYNTKAHSNKDARGLMQITYGAWKHSTKKMGVNWDYYSSWNDPEKNIDVGCGYLSWLQNNYLPKFFTDMRVNSTQKLSKANN